MTRLSVSNVIKLVSFILVIQTPLLTSQETDPEEEAYGKELEDVQQDVVPDLELAPGASGIGGDQEYGHNGGLPREVRRLRGNGAGHSILGSRQITSSHSQPSNNREQTYIHHYSHEPEKRLKGPTMHQHNLNVRTTVSPILDTGMLRDHYPTGNGSRHHVPPHSDNVVRLVPPEELINEQRLRDQKLELLKLIDRVGFDEAIKIFDTRINSEWRIGGTPPTNQQRQMIRDNVINNLTNYRPARPQNNMMKDQSNDVPKSKFRPYSLTNHSDRTENTKYLPSTPISQQYPLAHVSQSKPGLQDSISNTNFHTSTHTKPGYQDGGDRIDQNMVTTHSMDSSTSTPNQFHVDPQRLASLEVGNRETDINGTTQSASMTVKRNSNSSSLIPPHHQTNIYIQQTKFQTSHKDLYDNSHTQHVDHVDAAKLPEAPLVTYIPTPRDKPAAPDKPQDFRKPPIHNPARYYRTRPTIKPKPERISFLPQTTQPQRITQSSTQESTPRTTQRTTFRITQPASTTAKILLEIVSTQPTPQPKPTLVPLKTQPPRIKTTLRSKPLPAPLKPHKKGTTNKKKKHKTTVKPKVQTTTVSKVDNQLALGGTDNLTTNGNGIVVSVIGTGSLVPINITVAALPVNETGNLRQVTKLDALAPVVETRNLQSIKKTSNVIMVNPRSNIPTSLITIKSQNQTKNNTEVRTCPTFSEFVSSATSLWKSLKETTGLTNGVELVVQAIFATMSSLGTCFYKISSDILEFITNLFGPGAKSVTDSDSKKLHLTP